MNEHIYTVNAATLVALKCENQQALNSLESGKVIYLSDYCFSLTEADQNILSDAILSKKHKNISYDYCRHKLTGLAPDVSLDLTVIMLQLMHRFAEFSKQLIDTLLPQYTNELKWGRTSYRPAEIRGRSRSKRQDDTRLHVDSFPATPVNGLRILRLFCNINPNGAPRIWHVGEPFSQVLRTFSKQIPPFHPFKAKLIRMIKATKSLRTPYDHFMLNLHDSMKLDDEYQTSVVKHRVDFPPQSSWLVFTDQVSHAALSGQFLLEQTFYLPVSAMESADLSPLKLWEKEKGHPLI